MKERPILFNEPMICAIVEGRKTQTRRVMTPQPAYVWGWGVPRSDPEYFCAHVRYPGQHQPDPWVRCPYGKTGDRLWVREAWTIVPATAYRASVGIAQTINPDDPDGAAIYRAGWDRSRPGVRWRPSIHMPRWASRIALEITSVRVERLQDMTIDDMRAEGVRPDSEASLLWRETLTNNFRTLWDQVNGSSGYGWSSNPFVWALGFQRCAMRSEPPPDDVPEEVPFGPLDDVPDS